MFSSPPTVPASIPGNSPFAAIQAVEMVADWQTSLPVSTEDFFAVWFQGVELLRPRVSSICASAGRLRREPCAPIVRLAEQETEAVRRLRPVNSPRSRQDAESAPRLNFNTALCGRQSRGSPSATSSSSASVSARSSRSPTKTTAALGALGEPIRFPMLRDNAERRLLLTHDRCTNAATRSPPTRPFCPCLYARTSSTPPVGTFPTTTLTTAGNSQVNRCREHRTHEEERMSGKTRMNLLRIRHVVEHAGMFPGPSSCWPSWTLSSTSRRWPTTIPDNPNDDHN